jgi:hypothetical protein
VALKLGNFGLGLPTLAGVVLGLRLYTGGRGWCVWAGVALLVLWGLMCVGRWLMPRWPLVGMAAIELWLGSSVLATAFATAAVAWLTLTGWLPAFLQPAGASKDALGKLSGLLVGAATAFTSLVWTKDIADGKGYFWPGTQFRRGLEGIYARLKREGRAPAGSSEAYAAIFLDVVPGYGEIGWGFSARVTRMRIVRRWVGP